MKNQSDLPSLQKENKIQLQALLGQEIFSGPLPPPVALKGYREISPDYPERLMKMAESHVAADVHKKYKEPFNITLGQVFSFILGLSGFGLSALLALRGLEAGAIAAALGGIAPIIFAAIGNLRK